MGVLSFPKRLFLDPEDSESTLSRIEPAPDCTGEFCLGQEDALDGPHFHLVVVGIGPDAGPQRCLIR